MSSPLQSLRAGAIRQLVLHWPILLLVAGALLVVPTLLVFWLVGALLICVAEFLVVLAGAARRLLWARPGRLGRFRHGGFT